MDCNLGRLLCYTSSYIGTTITNHGRRSHILPVSLIWLRMDPSNIVCFRCRREQLSIINGQKITRPVFHPSALAPVMEFLSPALRTSHERTSSPFFAPIPFMLRCNLPPCFGSPLQDSPTSSAQLWMREQRPLHAICFLFDTFMYTCIKPPILPIPSHFVFYLQAGKIGTSTAICASPLQTPARGTYAGGGGHTSFSVATIPCWVPMGEEGYGGGTDDTNAVSVA